MLFIDILLLFLYEVDSYESTSWVYESSLWNSHESAQTFEFDNLGWNPTTCTWNTIGKIQEGNKYNFTFSLSM